MPREPFDDMRPGDYLLPDERPFATLRSFLVSSYHKALTAIVVGTTIEQTRPWLALNEALQLYRRERSDRCRLEAEAASVRLRLAELLALSEETEEGFAYVNPEVTTEYLLDQLKARVYSGKHSEELRAALRAEHDADDEESQRRGF